LEDLIYKFLVQANFPRAAIVTDVSLIDGISSSSDASFVVVDPSTIERLAVIKVVGPVNAELLIEQAALLSGISDSVGGKQVQGFVVRVDTKASREAEQVQFYRCHPNTELQQLNARTFPDMGSLLVHHRLLQPKQVAEPQSVTLPEDDAHQLSEPTLAMLVPGIILILLGLIDLGLRVFSGSSFIDLHQAVLLGFGVTLLALPALLRYNKTLH